MSILRPQMTKFCSCLLLISAIASGCATHADSLVQIRQTYYSGDLDQTTLQIDELIATSKADADAVRLDRALVELTSGKPEQAEATLREMRDRLDHLEQKDVGEEAMSMLRDENAKAYSGDDYERILIRVFLALSNLMTDGEDAAAYALQVNEKQNQVIAKLEKQRASKEETLDELEFRRIALGPYVHAAIVEERHLDFDDLERSRVKVVNWESSYRDGAVDLERAKNGYHSQPGHGVLYVFSLVGRGPYKEEVSEVPTSAAMFIADRIISHNASQTLTPTLAPIKVPRVIPGRSLISGVAVSVGGEELGETTTITDISEFAVKQAEADFPNVLARAVVRRAIKKAAMYAVKEQVDAGPSILTNLAIDAAGVIWEGAENADTRCWGVLPDEIQVLRVELPVGSHEVELTPAAGDIRYPGRTVSVDIREGRNTYMLSTIPDTKVIGEVLVGPKTAF